MRIVILGLCAFASVAGAQEVPVVLFPFHEATVASPLDSELLEYCYKIGEPFTNGAVIARLNDSHYRVSYARALEHRDFTVRVEKEQSELRSKDFASEMELRRAQYDAKIAAADFEEAELNLRRCCFIAPFDGKIAEFLTQRYETVKPGQPLFRIIEDDRLLAVANLPLGAVKVGECATIVPDGGEAVEGKVYEIAPQADNRTGTVRVRLVVENENGRLTAGMTGVLKLGGDDAETEPKPVACEPEVEIPALVPAGRVYASVQDVFSEKKIEDTVAPELAIEAMGFENGRLGYSLRRESKEVSLQSLKRIGWLTAGIYDCKAKRVACIAACQVALPGSGCTLTNAVNFSETDMKSVRTASGPLKLVLVVESDVRAIDDLSL